ncbi:hypothetical protein ABB37_04418 [Leptomonas pyrrhocoris]|uniref:Uncharacterized protein n=1 Tax=Leptomonas pyrrhocoris TaxID=157538 RepID=A0A0N0VFF9_LEPPY|nr:hypothetical protein ABB37_04418 [Leptomonas pyrrhocoris]XP_015659492.1 hypothetical protein ABB37_04418 [Leptomonas pyrrhocoris]KPA81052.1 hypothetical protein ABB37_04418 [Leptomonas pyrrhocoris]KPA81053.1 hypothetical protein ABB37_04418 [Leptomonas pyrrhocoris]|eukprot:XP_015659491.1 hypothetical protein ABB37_04418 [Leptomonas pyrrhocoris]
MSTAKTTATRRCALYSVAVLAVALLLVSTYAQARGYAHPRTDDERGNSTEAHVGDGEKIILPAPEADEVDTKGVQALPPLPPLQAEDDKGTAQNSSEVPPSAPQPHPHDDNGHHHHHHHHHHDGPQQRGHHGNHTRPHSAALRRQNESNDMGRCEVPPPLSAPQRGRCARRGDVRKDANVRTLRTGHTELDEQKTKKMNRMMKHRDSKKRHAGHSKDKVQRHASREWKAGRRGPIAPAPPVETQA